MTGNHRWFRRWSGAILFVTVTMLAGCGDGTTGDGTTTPTVDPSVQTQLRQDVRSLAAALAGDHLPQARSALAALNADTAAAYAAGKLDRDHLNRIRSAAAVLSRDLERLSSSPAATVTVTPTPAVTVTADPPPPPKTESHDHHGKDGGPAKGGDHEKKDKPHDHGPGKGKP